MSTVTPVQLVAPVQLAGTDAAPVYTVPTGTSAKIGRAVFYNSDTAVHTITAGISLGGALTAATTLLNRSLAPKETYVSPELAGANIPAGSAIRAFAETGSQVTFTASGLTIV